MRRTRTLPMLQAALFAALLALCSQIMIPLPPILINFALFGVFLAGALLGAQGGALAVGIYLLLAAAGVPVMAGFTGGVARLLGPTGGYAVGYLPAAICTGLAARRFGESTPALLGGMAAGTLCCYLLGTLWYSTLTATPFLACLTVAVLPFLPGDALKMLLAATLARKLKPILRRQGLI